MPANVFADMFEVACKAGNCQVIAAFPDVCLSPPTPPVGPVPIPYPNTSFSRDMMAGSLTVKIGGMEVMLKDQSFYMTKPLGDEAATPALGAGVVTHTIMGITHFCMWSFDVMIEGMNVDRAMDITTSNHMGPKPGNTPPWPNMGMIRPPMPSDFL